MAERTREIGIRVALGAPRGEIATLVLREAVVVALIGLVVETLAALAMACFLPTEGIGWSGSRIFLHGISRTDSLTYFSSCLRLTIVVVAACWTPERRAAKVDPQGRQLTLPFAFAYDSNGAVPAATSGTVPYLFKSGWSYSVPMLVAVPCAPLDYTDGQVR